MTGTAIEDEDGGAIAAATLEKLREKVVRNETQTLEKLHTEVGLSTARLDMLEECEIQCT